MNNGIIIGIAGIKNSGKDTAASMLTYIFRNGTAANYRDWSIKYDTPNGIVILPVVRCGDYLKDVLSELLNIKREYFDIRMCKDESWFALDTRLFITDEEVKKSKYYTIEPIHLTAKPFADYINYNEGKCCIRLRTLMQYFGTDVIRRTIGENVWRNKAIRDAKNIATKYGFCFIPDIRFNNEAEGVMKQLNGFVLRLYRDIDIVDNHESERIDIKDDNIDYAIDNNGSKLTLFHNLIKFKRYVDSKAKS